MIVSKRFKQNPLHISIAALCISAMMSSCGSFTAALQKSEPLAQVGANDPQFIEDFYLDGYSEPKLVLPRDEKKSPAGHAMHGCLSFDMAAQLPMSEELQILGDNIRAGENAEHQNIGDLTQRAFGDR